MNSGPNPAAEGGVCSSCGNGLHRRIGRRICLSSAADACGDGSSGQLDLNCRFFLTSSNEQVSPISVEERFSSRPIESCRETSPGRACRDWRGVMVPLADGSGILARSTRSVLGCSPQARGTSLREQTPGTCGDQWKERFFHRLHTTDRRSFAELPTKRGRCRRGLHRTTP